MRFDYSYVEDFGSKFSPRFSAKIRFKRTDNRGSIRIGADEDGAFDPQGGDGAGIGAPGFQDSDDAKTAIALGWDVARTKRNLLDLSLSLRRREGEYQPYFKIYYRFNYGIGENWVGNIRNSFFDFSESGIENTFSFDFERAFGSRKQFFTRFTFAGRFREFEEGMFWANRFSLYQITSPKSFWAYELLSYFST